LWEVYRFIQKLYIYSIIKLSGKRGQRTWKAKNYYSKGLFGVFPTPSFPKGGLQTPSKFIGILWWKFGTKIYFILLKRLGLGPFWQLNY